eukprot:20357_1
MKIQKISTGDEYTNFINDNGQLFVCGYDSYVNGVLGLGKETTQARKITQIPTETTFMDIFCGSGHTLALDCNEQIWSWGRGYNGQLGHGDKNNRYKPTKIQYFMNKNLKITQICSGGWHNLLLSNRKITQIPTETTFMDIFCGSGHTLALDCNEQIWSWGRGYNGQLGHGDKNNRYKPTKIQYFMNKNLKITQICSGGWHNLLLSNRKITQIP